MTCPGVTRTGGRDAAIASWRDPSNPLEWAGQIEGRRPAILVVDDQASLDTYLGDVTDVTDENLGQRQVAGRVR